jgi:hypothetical protein
MFGCLYPSRVWIWIKNSFKDSCANESIERGDEERQGALDRADTRLLTHPLG